MQVRTRHTPAFGVARLMLAPDEAVRADYGAMMATSFGVVINTGGRGGKRARGTYEAVFTAPAEGGWIDLAPGKAGDVHTIEMDGTSGWCVARGSALAMASSVRPDPQWPGLHALFGSEGGFVEHLTGHGAVVLACGGALDLVMLEAGEFVTVAPEYLLAYHDAIQCRLRAVDQTSAQSVRTGEGLLLDFAGPGQLLIQTRNF
ncbi:uncharacterized protein (AIM24 family) [Herbihabitans rhizosphaerae]|uniref:Uncharacterized protein (AIM24 family) n=1 Tax=Herbihabitans rhizosphaerae TaxID=1872711 RepID=A0A4Q7KVP2_9PSEU|nr:AIM24 family protein [Herbihabitans rhizosphaerae]RZS41099.1 uncharacterized protein (AIM24 family) [Herbihabitans rhizosphaerae]